MLAPGMQTRRRQIGPLFLRPFFGDQKNAIGHEIWWRKDFEAIWIVSFNWLQIRVKIDVK